MSCRLSIVVPTYNREHLIGRAIASCLAQDGAAIEVIVVDDGSEDSTCERVLGFDDGRLKLLRHGRNLGRGSARNTGMAAASGDWLVFLDSDDELLPGAVRSIARLATSVSDDVVALRFMCRDSRGALAPDPPHQGERLDYVGYLGWLAQMRGRPTEALPCTRCTTFPGIRYSPEHATEAKYHLDIARAGTVVLSADVVRRYHYDAEQRVSEPSARQMLRQAAGDQANAAALLATHGGPLRAFAPELYDEFLRHAATASLLAADRRQGIRYAAELLRRTPRSWPTWAITTTGLLHRTVLARLLALRTRAAWRDLRRAPSPQTTG